MKNKSSLLLADRIDYETLVKEAFLMGLMKNVGKVIVKNPLTSAGAALTGLSNASDMAGAASRAGGSAKRSRNLMSSVVSPPNNM